MVPPKIFDKLSTSTGEGVGTSVGLLEIAVGVKVGCLEGVVVGNLLGDIVGEAESKRLVYSTVPKTVSLFVYTSKMKNQLKP